VMGTAIESQLRVVVPRSVAHIRTSFRLIAVVDL
jgi:hypothetical protein